ncbi:MAG TPA: hypothetical protein VGJ71_02640 [Candidatus Limnocylindrales bacterium]|jgi:hypothetical protein
MAQRTRTIGAVLLIATGLVWIGQGTGLLKSSSFMTGDPFWAWLGAACVAGGLVVGFVALRAPRR